MSGTYTAWNGEERPWPPPENWYRAADGRWWHPAYGPDDGPDDRPESLPVWDVTNRHTHVDDAGQEFAAAVDIDAEASPTAETEPERETESELEPETEREPEPETEPSVVGPVATSARGRKAWVTGALMSVAVLGIAALAQFVLAGSNDDVTISPDGPAAVTGDALTTVTPSDASSTVASPDVSSSSTAETEITGTDAGEPVMAAESDPDVAATIAEFRRQMSERGLSTAELTDEQITTFAATYCVYAGGAEDRAAFDELRRVAVTSSRSSLTPTQLNLTITTAVVVFCPEESDRLGITFDG